MQPPRRRRRWILWLIILIVVVGGGWYLSGGLRAGLQQQGLATEPTPVTVRLETYQRTVSAPGTLRALRRAGLSAEVSGTVASVARVGDEVQAGEALLRFDTGPLERAVSQAQIALGQAQAQLAIADGDHRDQRNQQEQELSSARLRLEEAQQRLATAQATLENSERLWSVGAETADALRRARETAADNQREVERASLALSTLQTSVGETAGRQSQDRRNRLLGVERAELDLRQAQEDLEAATVRAPFAGSVASVEVAEGDRVASGTPLLTLLDGQRLELRGEVGEATVGLVRPGQQAHVRADAAAGSEVVGAVRSVSPEARVVQGVPVFDVLVELEAGATLRPGMTAEALIQVEEVQGAARLPLAALQASPGGAAVELRTAAGSELRPVTVLGQQGLEVVVRGDLREGDTVLVPATVLPPSTLGPGF